MYKQFFGLKKNPFSMNPDPGFLYLMPQTREALAALEYGISTHKGFLVLTGPVGTGKTTLLRTVLARFDHARVWTSYIFNPRLEVLEFLEFVLHDFGLRAVSRTKAGMLIMLNTWLIERFRRGETAVIVIDEAQLLSPELLEEVRLLTNLETGSEKLLQIVLCGQPELEDKLREPELRQVRQRVTLWSRTAPISLEDIYMYITTRLSIAGAERPIFTLPAIARIHRASRGIPRTINLICEHALIHAYAEQQGEISAELVDEVLGSLEPAMQDDPFPTGSGESAR